MIVVDTTVWIDFFNNQDSREKRALIALIESSRPIYLTELVLAEILRGMEDEKDYQTARHALSHFPVLKAKPIETYVHAANLYRLCRAKGVTVRSTIDCLIAAICIENKARLLHHDRDFDHLAQHTPLHLLNPTAILSQ